MSFSIGFTPRKALTKLKAPKERYKNPLAELASNRARLSSAETNLETHADKVIKLEEELQELTAAHCVAKELERLKKLRNKTMN